MDLTRRFGIECCKKFFGLGMAEEYFVAGEAGGQRLFALWEDNPATYYANPLHLLRQEWWHAYKDFYRHPGFWWQFEKGSVIAEYGAGVGAVSLPGIMQGLTVELIDIPGCAIDYLRWKFARCPNVRVLTCEEWWGTQSCVDGLVCVDVLEHIPDPMPVQERLWARLTAPGHALLKLEPSYPHEGHLEASCAQAETWQQWIADTTDIVEIGTYYWVRKYD